MSSTPSRDLPHPPRPHTHDVVSATSGLSVSLASTTPAVCTLNGTTVTLVAVGVCAIEATQAGNVIYNAAAPVSRSFTITAPGQPQQTLFLPQVQK